MARALPDNKKRVHEIKVRFSDEEIALAEEYELKTGKSRAVVLRELYMDKVRAVLHRYKLQTTAA